MIITDLTPEELENYGNSKVLQFKGTQGNFAPEPEPTYNEGANAYQVAILNVDPETSDIIPGFAFGRTEEICMANAHLFANAKLVLTELSSLIALHSSNTQPSIEEWKEQLQRCQQVMELSYGQYKTVNIKEHD